MTDYTSQGFDEFLRKDFNPLPETLEDDIQIQTPQIPTSSVSGDVPKEQIDKAVNDISRLSQVTTAQFLGLPSGSVVTLTSTIKDLIYPDKIVFAIPEITAYHTASGNANNIIRPSSVYGIATGFDYDTNARLASNGKSLTAYHMVYNGTGSSKNIFWIIRWRFIGTNTASL